MRLGTKHRYKVVGTTDLSAGITKSVITYHANLYSVNGQVRHLKAGCHRIHVFQLGTDGKERLVRYYTLTSKGWYKA